MASFETVADGYDAARPSYPPGVFEALGSLGGQLVLEVGAGTGIATRQLLDYSARVIVVDRGPEVLRRATSQTPGLPAVISDGAVLPIRAGTVDLICYAQAWHWLDDPARITEAHRVLQPEGRWAGWWNHARADESEWFNSYWSTIEHSCPGTHRDQRDIDWGATLQSGGYFTVGDRIVVPWLRQVAVDQWMTDQASYSYIVALEEDQQTRLLGDLRLILEHEFPNGAMKVPYETWLWIAERTEPPSKTPSQTAAR